MEQLHHKRTCRLPRGRRGSALQGCLCLRYPPPLVPSQAPAKNTESRTSRYRATNTPRHVFESHQKGATPQLMPRGFPTRQTHPPSTESTASPPLLPQPLHQVRHAGRDGFQAPEPGAAMDPGKQPRKQERQAEAGHARREARGGLRTDAGDGDQEAERPARPLRSTVGPLASGVGPRGAA